MDVKQVIIVRKDLNMRKGKIATQTAHASMGAVLSVANYWHRPYIYPGEPDHPTNHLMVINMDPAIRAWLDGRFTKICVSCDSEEELLELTKQAEDANLLHFLCRDAGITEFNGVPTYTALAIGPASVEDINIITGHLKLL